VELSDFVTQTNSFNPSVPSVTPTRLSTFHTQSETPSMREHGSMYNLFPHSSHLMNALCILQEIVRHHFAVEEVSVRDISELHPNEAFTIWKIK
jgi:hypothetical protein